jgi:hypothetical protein
MASEIFYVGLYTFCGTLILAGLRTAYKSKCSQFEMCYCFKLTRDTLNEEKIDELNIERSGSPASSKTPSDNMV